ncbi:hypothetical protein [Pontibacter beigongshangensis]|uniref:hypothetical protein n=1 Tax=Pontibacter beigongshangensis TaxID=2574733 RepID=UPI00164F5B99|nr:hypothetical protein [Pontibacter beigongshangensis]
MKKIIIVATLLATTLSVSASSFTGQDTPAAANDSARKFSQLLDTNFMRLLEIELKPGDFTTVHANPEHLAYAATAATLLITTPDGTTQLIKVKPGDQLWSGVTAYKTVNVGKANFKAVVYEDKAKGTTPQPQKFITLLSE